MGTSELERARAVTPGVPDRVLVERLVEQLGLILELQPPTDLHRAASYQGIQDIQVTEMDWAGMLAPANDGGFIIRVRGGDPPHRRNFTIGHEITHTLLPGYAVIQHRCGGRATTNLLANRHLENLADVGAAEFLLPKRFLQPIFKDMRFDLADIKRIADTHHASLDATLRRFLALTTRSAIVIDLRQVRMPDGSTIASVHRVFSNSEWCPVAPSQLQGTTVPPAHPINDVFGSSAVSDVAELSFLPITTPVAYISSTFDPYTDNEGRIVMRSLVLATPRRVLSVHAVDRGRLPAAG